MRVLVACEYSGRVREAFRRRGHDAWSCDLLPTEVPGPHYQCDLLDVLTAQPWDLVIAHPPCTHLANSGARWFKGKALEQAQAVAFVKLIAEAPAPKIAIENPVGVLSSRWRKPDQIVHPWWFGDEASKATCLWLKGLPLLQPTKIVGKGRFHTTKSGRRLPAWYNLPPSPDRGKLRSATFPGFAEAMADQWGAV